MDSAKNWWMLVGRFHFLDCTDESAGLLVNFVTVESSSFNSCGYAQPIQGQTRKKEKRPLRFGLIELDEFLHVYIETDHKYIANDVAICKIGTMHEVKV